tara:strand:- start:198 stop:815 length:618 start_codon:yes stop_codon:yes gene_type:complete
MINDEDNPKFWENIYKNDDAGWDLGGPTPVFVKISSILKPKKLCIIGCGKGYDAVMFAKNNFDVTAVDFAPSAVTSLRILARENKVIINVLEQDIFSLASQYDNHFDYVIEQTCFCAIHPNKRAEYEKLVYRILKTNGKLIGLWFPLDKNINEGGPPYGTTVKEVKSLFKDRWMLESEEFPKDSIKPRKSREKLLIFEKFENSID